MLKDVPASNEVLDSPFGIPQGGGVRTLSKKSKLRDLASGKSNLTWQWTLVIRTNQITLNNLLPEVGAISEAK